MRGILVLLLGIVVVATTEETRFERCQEGQSTYDGCNSCGCSNGHWVCTLRACPPEERDPFFGLPENALCVPGSRWKDECNWCRCLERGAAACTLKGCHGQYQETGPTCDEGSYWREDCNLCHCVEGGVSSCTKRLCRDKSAKQPVCEGDPQAGSWMDDCNWCTCNEGQAGCTKKGCLPVFLQLNKGPKCKGIVQWKRDCNTCYCNNDRAICDTRSCGLNKG